MSIEFVLESPVWKEGFYRGQSFPMTPTCLPTLQDVYFGIPVEIDQYPLMDGLHD